MTDNMDTSKMELDPKNELIKNRPWMGKNLHSPNELATLVHLFDNHETFSIHPVACLRFHKSCYLNGLDSDNMHSLCMEELVFVCTFAVPKYYSEKNTKMNEQVQKLNRTHYTLTQVVV